MATQEETLRIINEIRGIDSIEELKTKLKELAESQELLEKTSGRATHGTRNLGWAALEASRAIEDLQYGFNGVVNNIPGLVMALGGTAGLTAVISLVSIGVNQLVKHWDDLIDVFSRSETGFDTTRTNLDNLGKAIETNKKELEKLKDIQSLNSDQQERYNLLTEQAIKLTVAKNREEEKHRAALEARTAATGKAAVAPEIKAGMAGMEAPQVEQMIRGVRESRYGELAGKRERVARARAARADFEAKGLEQGGPEDDRTARELIEATRDLAASEGRISREAEETVGLARRGEVPAFQQIQRAAAAQPFRFQGLEQFFGVGPARTPEQEAGARKRAAQEETRAAREWQGKFARADREAQRVEQESERLAAQEARRLRREEIQGVDAQNRMDQLGARNAERARAQREREGKRAAGEEFREQKEEQQAGMHEATAALHRLAAQQARATGTTVENQMMLLQQNEYVMQQLQMVYQNAAMVRRMAIQQAREQRRALEERRNQQNNGD